MTDILLVSGMESVERLEAGGVGKERLCRKYSPRMLVGPMVIR